MRFLVTAYLLTFCFASLATADILADGAASLDAMMTALTRDGSLDLDGEGVLATRIIPEFYAANGNAPAWTDPATVSLMLAAIENTRDDGLDPADYHGPALAALGADLPQDGVTLARRDVLLTDALYAMVYHLLVGKADPGRLDADWNIDELYGGLDVDSADVRDRITARILAAIADRNPASILDLARPERPLYRNLRAALAHYRELAAAGGWPEIPDGPTLREGDTDRRVPTLRRRLAITGDLGADAHSGDTFDADLTAAVIHFQKRHGLDADGAVGKGTLAALNVPAAVRVDQLRINLDRARWVMHKDVGSDLVLVNVAAFEVWLVRDNALLWRSRVQVGKPYTRTPIFADNMVYLELNPTWTLPASIANKSTLAKLKADAGYLAKHNMVLLDSNGREVSADSVDWSTVSRMPYTVRQEPGPDNALGRVKFIFPNKHAVYLHDTPSKQYFSRAERTFSHGCIRTENPLDLAALLLDDQSEWTRERIDAVIESGKRTAVHLSKPLPVFLLYWTAFDGLDGAVNFREDVYDRDAAVLKALNGGVVARRRPSGN